MSVPFFLNQMAFLHVFLRAISFFQVFFNFPLLQEQHFASLGRIGVPQKEEKYHFSFSLIKRHFCMYFYVPFHFFKLFFNFPFVAKAAFCNIECIGVPKKEEKCQLSLFLIKRHFCMYFYVPFHFFKVFFNFASIAKAGFCKSRAHKGTPKGGKMSLLFFSIETAFWHVFLRAISFFKIFFNFPLLQKQHLASLRRIGVPRKEEKSHFSFFLIKRHFCMYFYVPFHFLKFFSIFLSLQKQHFAI